MSGALFDDSEFEVPLFREPRARKGPAVGSWVDARFQNDYPEDWNRCTGCDGTGLDGSDPSLLYALRPPCGKCLGMGSLKARVRLEAGHRCIRCRHPYIPKGDAKMLGVEPTPHHWSPCDQRCEHGGPIRWRLDADEWNLMAQTASTAAEWIAGSDTDQPVDVEAEWRILTVHHLDGDKANCRWWNLAALCQRCHLEIQAKVVMERVWPHEHSAWFRPYVAGYYAFVYLGEDLSRDEVAARQDELLALERA